MLVPVNWMKDYVDLDEKTMVIANKVTDSGSHVEAINRLDEGIEGLVVGQVLDIRKHENADKLLIVKLDIGERETELVTGAKNFKIGDKLVVAKKGAVLPGGFKIEPVDFKGVVSPGMLCSYEELGVSESFVPKKSRNGVIVLSQDAQVGANALEVLEMDTEVIEFEITPNRPDCLSIIGMAREAGASFGKHISYPDLEIESQEGDIEDYFDGVELETGNARRFMLGLIRDVTITDSPQWMQNKLINAGMRPINNIVDITNFIMLEFGQPLHAYDFDKIKGGKLIVRMSQEGEKLVTLDKQERKLDNDLLICDGENKPIGLAGVMGGYETEVEDDTKNILIESASFAPEPIRRTSKRLDLRSEASSRYEKDIPVELQELAIKRFFKLIEETTDAKIIKGVFDEGKDGSIPKKIRLRNQRSNLLLGVDLDIEESKKYLESLDLDVRIDGDDLIVGIPFFRGDLNIEVDLIEEIGRMYGYHNIEPKALAGSLTEGRKSEKRQFIDQLRLDLFGLGFSEILTYSFISDKLYEKLNLEEDNKLRDVIRIINPLGEDFSVMRTTLMGNMLDVIRKNLNNKQEDLRLSEVGNAFFRDEDRRIYEDVLMCLSLVGDYDFYYIKDVLVEIFEKHGIKAKFRKNTENPIFHNGRCADIFVGKELVGSIGEIHPLVRANFDISKRVYMAEVNVDKLLDYKQDTIKYEKISKYPMIERDLALVVDRDEESEKIVEVMVKNGGENLKSVDLFDIYTGEQIADDKKSLAYSLGFQSDERTLKEKEVNQALEKIYEGLKEEFNIEVRS